MSDDLLAGLEVVQMAEPDASPLARRAVDFAGQMARQCGATVLVTPGFDTGEHFLGRGKAAIGDAPAQNRVLLVAGTEATPAQDAAVVVQLPGLATEATVFAESGLADLLGDPDREPIIPTGEFGAGTIGYSAFAAVCALYCKSSRLGRSEAAVVDGVGALAWVNWKAGALGKLGRDIEREGSAAEWPVLRCADGYFALVYQQRDWPSLVAFTGDARLEDGRFSTSRGRAEHRAEMLGLLSDWAQHRTRHELMAGFLSHQIPAAPVLAPRDLLDDALLAHRGGLVEATRASGAACLTPVLPHRVAARGAPGEQFDRAEGDLPLGGIRVLDLGIITAGAGVSALLADLGAEVLKIESFTYPDPFRQWAGESVSPLFKCNNRNKFGLALDLKTDQGRADFLRLVAEADVVVENFRRGVLDRLGFSFDALQAANRNILLASISSQGLTGPGSGATSFGSTLEASSGFAAAASYGDGAPFVTGRNVNYPDQTVVLYAAAVITAALAKPERGMHLDVAQRDVAIFLSGERLEQLASGETAAALSNGRTWRSADGRWVAVADDAVDGDWFAARSADEAVAELEARGVGAAVVRRGSEMFAALRRQGVPVFAESPAGELVKGFPFQFEGSPMTIRLDSPEVGEHNRRFGVG